MGANDEEGREQPIPKLPEDLVLAHVVPRLPWYTRPVCRTLSKSWRALIDTRNPELDLQTRTIQLPLLRGLFFFCTFDQQIFISDPEIKGACRMNGYQVQAHWRRLPPLQSLAAPRPIRVTMVASCGMVYVWPMCAWADEEGQLFVFKLDIGCADCTWKKCSVPFAFDADGVVFNGSIYVPRVLTGLASPKTAVFVYDMSTDTCKQVETWVQDDFRVLSRSTDSGGLVEEMYGFVDEKYPTVVMYDVVSDCWRTCEELLLPNLFLACPELVKLLNAECFEPVPETGTKLIWIDYERRVISWFDSSDRNYCVYIDYTTCNEGMCLEHIEFIRGSMYAIFLEQKDDLEDGKEEEEDGGNLADLFKRVLMKGRIIVASRSVAWEKVHELGFFYEGCRVGTSFRQPIDWFTTMA